MKKILARFLVLLLLLTSVVIPADKEISSRAAEKMPTLYSRSGIEKINLLTENIVAGEVGKTITLTNINVKKGNVKDIAVYVSDPRVATVTKKFITKKKSGFKIKIKKLGETDFSVRITLKKKQAGEKIWNNYFYVKGVKKLTKKELAALPDTYMKANQHSTILNKYANFMVRGKEYDESGKLLLKTDIFQTKEDMYIRDEDIKNNRLAHTYYSTPNTGYNIINENGVLSDYYFCRPSPSENLILPVPDDPELYRYLRESTDPEYGYTDGKYYYLSDVTNSKAEEWIRTESILNAKTYEAILTDFYRKNKKGKIYKYLSQGYEHSVAEPDLYRTTKYQYAAEGKEKVKIESVINPGTSEEQRISMEIPQGAPIKFGFLNGYNIYTDAEGITPISKERDTSHDFTAYYIKEETA